MMLSMSFSIGSTPTELNGVGKGKDIALSNKVTGSGSHTLNVADWLPHAAEVYKISPKLSDYILVPVPSIISDLPNTNGDSASAAELLRFNPDAGVQAYRTWVGKPTHVEHDNKILDRAKGVIFDVMLKPMPGFVGNHFKCVKLLGFDRTKDPILVSGILNGSINTYSMGMWFKTYTCSVCGNRVGPGGGRQCDHTQVRRKTYMRPDGQLVFRRCEGILGFETSAVVDPAYVVANSDIIMDINQFSRTGQQFISNKNNVRRR